MPRGASFALGAEDRRGMEDAGRHRILIGDDDPDLRALLADVLSEQGYQILQARTGNEVVRMVTTSPPDLLLLDLRLPDHDGLDLLRRFRDQEIKVPVIVITAHGSSTSAIQAIQLGAYDYILKPFELGDVVHRVRQFFEYQRLSAEVQKLRRLDTRELTERIIGNSAVMQEVYKLIGKVAQSDATVLITGETGTGKELVAETIHNFSAYRSGPLVKVNCAALPETLLESELFGHEKGSFTGALNQRKGRFELANRGTIFLDEVGEMSLNTQKKLLRVLQEKSFERVGGTTSIQVDCRVIAATNKNLLQEVAEGRFREDLYYRLNVVHIHLPPLRERKEDIPLLVEHFLHRYRAAPGAPPSRISEEAMELLLAHDWPGNVREMENTIERAVVLAQGGVITPEHLFLDPVRESRLVDLEQRVSGGDSLQEILADVERRTLKLALERTRQDLNRAARLLKIDLEDLERRLHVHGLQ